MTLLDKGFSSPLPWGRLHFSSCLHGPTIIALGSVESILQQQPTLQCHLAASSNIIHDQRTLRDYLRGTKLNPEALEMYTKPSLVIYVD